MNLYLKGNSNMNLHPVNKVSKCIQRTRTHTMTTNDYNLFYFLFEIGMKLDGPDFPNRHLSWTPRTFWWLAWARGHQVYVSSTFGVAAVEPHFVNHHGGLQDPDEKGQAMSFLRNTVQMVAIYANSPSRFAQWNRHRQPTRCHKRASRSAWMMSTRRWLQCSWQINETHSESDLVWFGTRSWSLPSNAHVQFWARQDVTGNRVMAGFIGEVLAACLRFRFDLLCFQEILIWFDLIWINASVAYLACFPYQPYGPAVPTGLSSWNMSSICQVQDTAQHRAEGMLRNNSCALIDEVTWTRAVDDTDAPRCLADDLFHEWSVPSGNQIWQWCAGWFGFAPLEVGAQLPHRQLWNATRFQMLLKTGNVHAWWMDGHTPEIPWKYDAKQLCQSVPGSNLAQGPCVKVWFGLRALAPGCAPLGCPVLEWWGPCCSRSGNDKWLSARSCFTELLSHWPGIFYPDIRNCTGKASRHAASKSWSDYVWSS